VIAIVDDEEMVLTSLRSFLLLETDYRVETFSSPQTAVSALRDKPVDLVISDYLMPGMNGIEFLLEMKALHPFATRILLTGYADKENAIKAINEVGLYQYVEKPWNNDDLKITIQNGLERRFLMEKLEQKIQEVQNVQQSLQDI
jgi:DNA-binding NtrC family response regulator